MRQKVQVIVERCGAWQKGDVFETSATHARQLAEQGMVQPVEGRAGRNLQPDTEALDEGGRPIRQPDVDARLEWPGWLKVQVQARLDGLGITPAEARTMDPNALQARVSGLGPRLTAMLQKDLTLQRVALLTDEELGEITLG